MFTANPQDWAIDLDLIGGTRRPLNMDDPFVEEFPDQAGNGFRLRASEGFRTVDAAACGGCDAVLFREISLEGNVTNPR